MDWRMPGSSVLHSLLEFAQIYAHWVGDAHWVGGPTLTSVHNYWKNLKFDYADLCRQNDVSVFKYAV